jgi:hypothetical protein
LSMLGGCDWRVVSALSFENTWLTLLLCFIMFL